MVYFDTLLHISYMRRHVKNNGFPIDFAIFTKALWTNGPTDQRTNQGTDKPSYRDACWWCGWHLMITQGPGIGQSFIIVAFSAIRKNDISHW